MAIEELNQAVCSEQLNSTFRLVIEGQNAIELLLSEVTPLRVANRQAIFSLVFRGPGELMLSQRTYHLAHDVIGEIDLMLVPVKQDSDGIYYEAVFNRLVEED